MVRHSTPASAQAMVMRRTFSVPALWPARRGKPRRFAQRPLPSMMMPTWAGTVSGSATGSVCGVDLGCAPATNCVTSSDLHNFRLLVPGDVVHTFHEGVCQLLQPLLRAALILLGDATVFLCLAQVIQGIASAIAQRDARFFGAMEIGRASC